jgi:hypothetical protein
VDPIPARTMVNQQTSIGRAEALAKDRPTDEQEPRRSYYHARHEEMDVRRSMTPGVLRPTSPKATGREERRTIIRGLWDGAMGCFGENPDFGLIDGELSETNVDAVVSTLRKFQGPCGSAPGLPVPKERMVSGLHHRFRCHWASHRACRLEFVF